MQFSTHEQEVDLIVVGGGLAGLTAATLVARAGRSVIVLERASELGGRAITLVEHDIRFNMGPHALYCRGRAFRVFQELGIPFTGGFPKSKGGVLVAEEATFPLPRGAGGLLSSRLFTWREKLTLAKILGILPRLDTRRFDSMPLDEWIVQAVGHGNPATFLRTLFRVSTYSDDASRMSAGAALDQFRLALEGNVWYLDGGWQTLVNGLRDRATERGAELQTRVRVASVQSDAEGVRLRLANGETMRARTAVLAIGPQEAGALLDLPADAPLVRWLTNRIPVRAACLDIALSRLPRPACCVGFGLDRPLYFSVHSASAELAPRNVAVLHVMKNLRHDSETNHEADRAELEGFLDRLQPGWRDHVVARRFLPGMTVVPSLPIAEEGGLRARPDVAFPGFPNIFLAGDWVGREGMLTDASAASASAAAGCVLAALSRSPVGREGSLTHGSS